MIIENPKCSNCGYQRAVGEPDILDTPNETLCGICVKQMLQKTKTANVIRKWFNTGEKSEVVVAHLPDEINGFQDQHPLDDQVFYWLDDKEWNTLINNKVFTTDEFRLTINERWK